MAGCKLGSSRVSVACPEVAIDSYCVSTDKNGNIRICFFQKVLGKEVAISRVLLPKKLAANLIKSLDGLTKIKPAVKEGGDEMRYIG